MSLSFFPLIEHIWLYGFIVLWLAIIALLLFLRPNGYGWRCAALSCLMLIMINPSLREEKREKLPTTVAIVKDTSPSQTLQDRMEVTQKTVEKLVSQLKEKGFETRVIEANDQTGSNLFASLKNGLSDISPTKLGGVIMVTDGQIHDVPLSFDLGVPLHGLITGKADDKDRRLVLEQAPRFGIVGQEVEVKIRIEDTPSLAKSARITINRDNEPPILRNFPTAQTITLRVPVVRAGENLLDISVEGLEGELTTLNNRIAISIEGVREKLRVMLVSGSPHAGERTWRNLLKSDPAIELVHFTILRSQEKAQFDTTPQHELALIPFPIRDLFITKINEFDLIIFDRYAQLGLIPSLYYENMSNYVKNGGAMLVFAGPEFARENSLSLTPLDDILPARPLAINTSPFKVGLSALGQKHPVTRDLKLDKASAWYRAVQIEKARGQNLLTASNNSPLLLLSREDKGRVALMLSDHMWLWSRGVDGGGPHQELLRRLAHWLMKEPELEEENLKLTSNKGDLTVFQQTMKEVVNDITLTSPTGNITKLTLEKVENGRYKSTVKSAELGLWKATNGVETRLHMVGAQNPKEWANVVSSLELLKPFAIKTGGNVWRVADFPRIVALDSGNVMSGADWMGLREQSVSRLTSLSLTPFLLGFLGLLGLLMLLARAWWRESK